MTSGESAQASTWMMLGLLERMLAYASRDHLSMISTEELLLSVSRRSGMAHALLRKALRGTPDRRALPIETVLNRSDLGSSQLRWETLAILREAIHLAVGDDQVGYTETIPWSRDAVLLLDRAYSCATSGIVSDREMLLALLMLDDSTRAGAWLSQVGVNRDALTAAVGTSTRTGVWAPAVEHLTLVGVAELPWLARMILSPIRRGLKRIGDPAGVIIALEEEARRQAIRHGAAVISLEYVLLAVLSIAEQIRWCNSGLGWPPGDQLAQCGLSYADASARLVQKVSDQLPWTLVTPSMSPAVQSYLGDVSGAGASADAVIRVLVQRRVPERLDAIQALGGDVDLLARTFG